MTYVKTINGRQVFSACKTIQTQDGTGISNPSSEQIAEAGGEEYIPPVIPALPKTEPGIDEIITAVKRMLATDASNLSDEEALSVAALYPTGVSKMNKSVSVGDRLGYDEKLYKVVQVHTVQEDGTPDVSASLYTEVSIEEGPAGVQPTGAQDAYNTGDKVTYNNKHWISNTDANVGEPGAYGGDEQ